LQPLGERTVTSAASGQLCRVLEIGRHLSRNAGFFPFGRAHEVMLLRKENTIKPRHSGNKSITGLPMSPRLDDKAHGRSLTVGSSGFSIFQRQPVAILMLSGRRAFAAEY
jgi:hypothetical protein